MAFPCISVRVSVDFVSHTHEIQEEREPQRVP